MKDKKLASELVDRLIMSIININDEDEMKAAHEWTSLDLSMKVKIMGILSHYAGHNKLKSLFGACKQIEKELGDSE